MTHLLKYIIITIAYLSIGYNANATISPINTTTQYYNVDISGLSSSVSLTNEENYKFGYLGIFNAGSAYTSIFTANTNADLSIHVTGSNPTSILDFNSLLSYGYTLLDITDNNKLDILSLLKKNTNLDLVSYYSVSSSNSYSLSAGNQYLFIFGSNDITPTSSKNLNGANFSLSFGSTAIAPVPEPEIYALMGIGLFSLLASSRRKQKSASANRMTAA